MQFDDVRMPHLGEDVDLNGEVGEIVLIVQDAHLSSGQLTGRLMLGFVHLKDKMCLDYHKYNK